MISYSSKIIVIIIYIIMIIIIIIIVIIYNIIIIICIIIIIWERGRAGIHHSKVFSESNLTEPYLTHLEQTWPYTFHCALIHSFIHSDGVSVTFCI